MSKRARATSSENPIESAMNKFVTGDKVTLLDFMTAWQFPPSVIAERLRRTGLPVNAKGIKDLLNKIDRNPDDENLVRIMLFELRNDINRALYGR